jgi:O-antigen/teichoic acid export membrane protein
MRTSTKLVLFAASSWGRLAIWMAAAVVITPLLIQSLGLLLFGLYGLVTAMTSMAQPLRVAVLRVMTREMAAARANKDERRIAEVFSNGLVVSGATSVILTMVMAVIVLIAPLIFNLPEEHVWRLRVALICECAVLLTVIALPAWLNIFVAAQRVMLANVNLSIERLLVLVAAIVISVLPEGYDLFIWFVCMRAGFLVAHSIVKVFLARMIEPAARFHASLLSKREMRSLVATGGWSLSNVVADVAFFTVDQPLLNVFFGPLYNALYRVYGQLHSMAQMLGNNLIYGIEGLATDMHERGAKASTRRLMLTTMRLTGSITTFCAVCTAVFTLPLLQVWLGDRIRRDEDLLRVMTYEEAANYLQLLAIVLMSAMALSQPSIAASRVLYGMGLIRAYSPAMLCGAGIKLVLAMVLLAAGAPPISVAVASLAAQLGLYGWFFPRLIAREVESRRATVYWEGYGRAVLAALPALVVALTLRLSLNEWDWRTLVVAFGATGAVWAPCFLLIGLTRAERSRIRELAMGGLRFGRRRLGRRAGRNAQVDNDGPMVRAEGRADGRANESNLG